MRFAFENYQKLRKKAIVDSHIIRENWTWENTAKKLLEALK